MASYRDKINQKQMSTETGKIAWCINFIKHPPLEFKNDRHRELLDYEEILLFDDISVYNTSEVYVICKRVPYKANRYLCKYLQHSLNYDQMVKMLNAQPWEYI